MRYRVFEGGAIASSAIALWGWASVPSQTPPPPCQPSSPQTTADKQPTHSACQPQKQLYKAGILPDSLRHLGWGRDRLSPDLEQVYKQVLSQAQAQANRDRIPEAILILGGIPKNSQQFPLAQQMRQEWSHDLVQQATHHYAQANLNPALKLLQSIPPGSQSYAQAKLLIPQWRQEKEHLHQAQSAAKAGHWQTVMHTIQRLQNSPLYHSSPVQTLLQSAMSQLYKPDDRLMQAVSSTTEPTTVRTKIPQFSTRSTQPDTLPDSPTLDIKTDQALTWAQPKNTPAIAHSNSPKPAPLPPNPFPPISPLFPVKVPQQTAIQQPQKPAIAPPERIVE